MLLPWFCYDITIAMFLPVHRRKALAGLRWRPAVGPPVVVVVLPVLVLVLVSTRVLEVVVVVLVLVLLLLLLLLLPRVVVVVVVVVRDPSRYHPLHLAPRQYVIAVSLPCYCHVIAMLLPCCCHVVFVVLLWYCHVIAKFLPGYCYVVAHGWRSTRPCRVLCVCYCCYSLCRLQTTTRAICCRQQIARNVVCKRCRL